MQQCIDTPVFAKEIHVQQAHDTKLNYMNMQFKAVLGLVMCTKKKNKFSLLLVHAPMAETSLHNLFCMLSCDINAAIVFQS